MTSKRLIEETTELEKNFPRKYRFENLNLQGEFLDIGVKTQSGKVYRLNIHLEADYPSSLPRVFIVYPLPLRAYDGSIIGGSSHLMHTLSNEGDKVQICHFVRERWNYKQSLYKIVMKARIWLEAYEGHLRTGKAIDDYLNNKI